MDSIIVEGILRICTNSEKIRNYIVDLFLGKRFIVSASLDSDVQNHTTEQFEFKTVSFQAITESSFATEVKMFTDELIAFAEIVNLSNKSYNVLELNFWQLEFHYQINYRNGTLITNSGGEEFIEVFHEKLMPLEATRPNVLYTEIAKI